MASGGRRVTLEIFKMGMYMAFPVTCFYVFNQPEIYRSIVEKSREEMPLKHLDTTDYEKDRAAMKRVVDKKLEEKEKRMREEYLAKMQQKAS